MRNFLWVGLSVFMASFTASALGQNSTVINIDETVTGNQEQPKVLYIVPWKTAANNEDFEQSLSSRFSQGVFQHLEKEELARQVKYLQDQQQAKTAE
jgi:hypothetical protein